MLLRPRRPSVLNWRHIRLSHGCRSRRSPADLPRTDKSSNGRNRLTRPKSRQRAGVGRIYARRRSIGYQLLSGCDFQEPQVESLRYHDFDADVSRARKLQGDVRLEPDLRPFMRAGGKLTLWHGWTDGVVAAGHSVKYFEAVSKSVGSEAARENMRLFMVPGVDHCGGGEGTFSFDAVAALEQWVEQGRAPERIIASRPLKGGSVRTRPLCRIRKWRVTRARAILTMR